MAYLADTVLPAPDSPDTMIDWSSSKLKQSPAHSSQRACAASMTHVYATAGDDGIKSMCHSPRESLERLLRHCEDVRVHAARVLAMVGLDCVRVVDGQVFIRIDGHQHNT